MFKKLKQQIKALETKNVQYETWMDDIASRLVNVRNELEPIKEFMKEHSQNVLEAESEYNRQQKALSDGIASITNYSYQTAMKKGDR